MKYAKSIFIEFTDGSNAFFYVDKESLTIDSNYIKFTYDQFYHTYRLFTVKNYNVVNA